jgi:hypothetical protein
MVDVVDVDVLCAELTVGVGCVDFGWMLNEFANYLRNIDADNNQPKLKINPRPTKICSSMSVNR